MYNYNQGDRIKFSFNQIIRAVKSAYITLSQEDADLINTFDNEDALLEFIQARAIKDLTNPKYDGRADMPNGIAVVIPEETDYDDAEPEDFNNFELTTNHD